jgi:N-acetylneuraminic acid mutarotase
MRSPSRLQRSVCLMPPFCIALLALFTIGCGGGSTSGTVTPPPSNAKEWTWVGGNNSAGATSTLQGIYGTQGVPSASNIPAGRSGAVSWIDASGNFWLFGGGIADPLGTKGPQNDLWEYNPTSKEWTWVSGSSTSPGNRMGIYGTQGTASSANAPGGRSDSVSWIDTSGNLWLFGGSGFDSTGQAGVLNDLWKFSPSTNQWTWVGGSDTVNAKANYGSLGVAATGNNPGARERAVSWTDSNGNFWLFGGDGYGANGSSGSFNDLWEFTPSTNEWTWVRGGSALNAAGVYGSAGVAAPGNNPGGRVNAVSWADRNGNLWLFGGLGYDTTGSEYDLNDLWEFNPSSKEWTWVSGSSAVSSVAPGALCLAGVFGTQGTADPGGKLWLFGGLGCDASGTAGALNDLWEFDTASKTWTWQSGSNSVGPAQGGTGGPSGTYGTQGTPATANTPGGRSGSAAWIDSNGSLWLFGGSGHDATGAYGDLNDLWSFTP